jgi:hypothetical protein
MVGESILFDKKRFTSFSNIDIRQILSTIAVKIKFLNLVIVKLEKICRTCAWANF